MDIPYSIRLVTTAQKAPAPPPPAELPPPLEALPPAEEPAMPTVLPPPDLPPVQTRPLPPSSREVRQKAVRRIREQQPVPAAPAINPQPVSDEPIKKSEAGWSSWSILAAGVLAGLLFGGKGHSSNRFY